MSDIVITQPNITKVYITQNEKTVVVDAGLVIPEGAGTEWLNGLTAPDNADGSNGDYYLRTDTGEVYYKEAGSWSLVLTIGQGPQGEKGDKGDTGAQGPAGQDGSTQYYATVTAVANTYTLDLSSRINFAIETTDSVAKSIVISNVPATENLIVQVAVKLKYTNAAAITHPAGTVWKDASTPTFTASKTYIILYTSYDAGVSWIGTAVGAW